MKDIKKIVALIRIKGEVGLNYDIAETLRRLGLRKKYSCVIISPEKVEKGMIDKVGDFIAYGEISEKTLKQLNEKRQGKIKNFFRLSPPRGGIDTKHRFPKGILGDNKENINELIERMI